MDHTVNNRWLLHGLFAVVVGILIGVVLTFPDGHNSSGHFDSAAIANVQRSTHFLVFMGSDSGGPNLCTGVAVAPDRILTAAHCENFNKTLDQVDTVTLPAGLVSGYLDDKHDHLIILFKRPVFTHWVKLANRMPVVGEPVFSVGYSAGSVSQRFHAGYVSSYTSSHDWSGSVVLYQLQNFFGDSGSGIFDADGNLLATESQIDQQGGKDFFQTYTMSVPYHFKNPIQKIDTVATHQKPFSLVPADFCTTVPLRIEVVHERAIDFSQGAMYLNGSKNVYMLLVDHGRSLQIHMSDGLFDTLGPSSSFLEDNGKVVKLVCK